MAAFIGGRDDSDILMRLRRREPEAVGLLHDRYGKYAYALALRIVKDPAIAEDIVAESMLKLWNRVAFFKETRSSALGAWFLSITFIHAREYVQQHDTNLSGDPAKESILERPLLFNDWQRSIDPERVEEMHLGVSLLSSEERRVLDTGFFEAIPSSRMAERLGINNIEIVELTGDALKKVSPPAGD